MPKKLLSIAIPTFNRAEKLRHTLENFICQITHNGLTDLVEIVISDNASTDNTAEMVVSLQSVYPTIISYHKNSKNIVWENIKQAANLSKGTFVWFVGDDDEYFFDCVPKIVHTLQQYHPDAMYVNQVNGRGYTTPVEKDCLVDAEEFFHTVHQDPEFISTVVIKKSKIAPSITNYTWYHLACLLNLPADSKFYITKEPFIYNKPNIRTWDNDKNLVYYTLDAIETIIHSTTTNSVKKHLLGIYNSFLIIRIENAKKHHKLSQNDIKNIATRLCNATTHLFDFAYPIKLVKSCLTCRIYQLRLLRKDISSFLRKKIKSFLGLKNT